MKKNILIIDDDPGIQDVLKIIFEKAGFNVAIESDGNAILNDKFKLPDIFLLDRYLSGIDGLDICRHLKNSLYAGSRHIPVIMVSASPNIATKAITAGADDFIEKPFKIADLVDVINRNLRKKS